MIGEATKGITFPAILFVKCPPTILIRRPWSAPLAAAQLALAVRERDVAADAVERLARLLRASGRRRSG